MKVWMGSTPTRCNLCPKEIKDYFMDAKTNQGPWGILCPQCFKLHGVGLGTGMGQSYKRNTETNVFEKIAG